MPQAGVVEVVHAIVRDAAATKTLKSRYALHVLLQAHLLLSICSSWPDTSTSTHRMHRHCLRLIPVELVCDPTVEAIAKASETLVKPHFPAEGPCIPFACVLECRSTKHLKKMDVIDAAIQSIPQVCAGYMLILGVT